MADTASVTVLTIHAEDVTRFQRIYKRLDDEYEKEDGHVLGFRADRDRLTFVVETTDPASLAGIA
jgi:hypothetical protein